jgi:hypothetical protein
MTKEAKEKTCSVSQAAPPVRDYPDSSLSQAEYYGTLDNEQLPVYNAKYLVMRCSFWKAANYLEPMSALG